MQLKKSIILCFLFSVIFISCSESITDNLLSNNSPDTHLFLYPDSTISKQSSNLKVHWWGDDADGIVVGYFMKWDGLDSQWGFTTKNDSTFFLPIGSIDTSFVFKIMAADNNGNGQYDDQIVRNGINFGAEPFIDKDNNHKYTPGEDFFDIGNIDQSPAQLRFPILNSSPAIAFNVSSVLPDTTFPVLTLSWDVKDLDGIQSVTGINIAINDTTKYVTLDGTVRMVTLRAKDFSTNSPLMEILINGDETKVSSKKLSGVKLNDTNVVYIQAQDMAGSKSTFIRQSPTKSCFIRKPKGKILLINDFESGDSYENKKTIKFYKDRFNQLYNGSMSDKYDFLDLRKDVIPYKNISFLKILKLYNYVFWYSSSRPSLDLLTVNVTKFIDGGGKMAFSLIMEDPSKIFNFDWNIRDLQSFLPVDSVGSEKTVYQFNPATVSAMPGFSLPELKNSSTITAVRTIYASPAVAKMVYSASSPELNGPVGFITNDKTMFFIGLPLNYCDKNSGSVKSLLQKVFEDFGLVL